MEMEKSWAKNDLVLVCDNNHGNEKGTDFSFTQMRESTEFLVDENGYEKEASECIRGVYFCSSAIRKCVQVRVLENVKHLRSTRRETRDQKTGRKTESCERSLDLHLGAVSTEPLDTPSDLN